MAYAVSGNKATLSKQIFNLNHFKILINLDALGEAENQFDTVSTRNAKIYYQSCLNEAKLEEIGEQELIDVINKELGGWSLLGSNKVVTSDSIFKKLSDYHRLGSKPLFNVYVSTNPKQPELYTLRVNLIQK